MNQADALKHIETLIEVADETDDLELIRKHHREVLAIIAKALPEKLGPLRPAGTADLYGVPRAEE